MTALVPGDFSYLLPYSDEVNREKFWMEVIAQLNKDFGADSAISVSKINIKSEEAAEAIVQALQIYLPSVTPNLSEILYRIDLEEGYETSLKGLPPDLYYRILAEMVLKRVVQKTLTRRILSKNKPI